MPTTATTTPDTRPHSRGSLRPSHAWISRPENRGRGECRVPAAPVAPCATKKHRGRSHRYTGEPGIPARNGFTTYFVLSPVIGLFCHRRLADTSARLERQRRGVRTTRLRRPLSALSSKAPLTSTASRPASVTIAIRPSCGTGCAYFAFDLGSRSTTPIAADWHDGQIIRAVQFSSASALSAKALSPAAEGP